MSHDYALFMHMYLSFPSFWYYMFFSAFLFVSLSIFQIVCAWHPSAKLLHPRTVFVLGHYHLIPLLFLSGSMMIKPVTTFQRTSPNVAFTWNAMLLYRISLILLLWLSYTGRVRNLFVRYPWVVPPWSYRSFTLICMILIILYLVSSLLFKLLV